MARTEWAREVTATVGGEIKRRRGKNTMQWLSDRTAAWGHRISPSRLYDLERGDRGGALGVAELLVLAAALQMPAGLLLFPPRPGEQAAALPDLHTNPWTAYKVFAGEIGLVFTDPAFPDAPNIALRMTADPAAAALRRHDDAVAEYQRRRESDPGAAEAWLTALAAIRREMVAQGWALPFLDIDALTALAALALEKMEGPVPSVTETL